MSPVHEDGSHGIYGKHGILALEVCASCPASRYVVKVASPPWSERANRKSGTVDCIYPEGIDPDIDDAWIDFDGVLDSDGKPTGKGVWLRAIRPPEHQIKHWSVLLASRPTIEVKGYDEKGKVKIKRAKTLKAL